MARRRTVIAVIALLALSVPFVAGATAASDAQPGVGDATAGLVGAHLEVEDLDGLTAGLLGELAGQLSSLEVLDTSGLDALDTAIDVGLLEGLTSATTRQEPDARASLSPLRLGEQRPHDVTVGPGESQGGDAVGPTPVSALLSGVALSAFDLSADAGDEGAIAVIEAVQASLDALGATGLDIGLTSVVSEVTRTGARAEQDLTVDGLAVGLGDVLPTDLLEALPLDALLSLIEELGAAGLLSGVDGLRADLEAAVAEVTAAIEAVNAFELGEVDEDLLDDLATALDLRDDLEGIEGLDDLIADALDLLGLGDLVGSSEEGELLAIVGLLEDADELGGIDVDEACLDDELTLDLLNALEACVADVLAQLDALIDDLLGDVAAALGLEDLIDLVADLLAALGDLDGLLDTIRGLIDDIAGLDLLAADSLVLEVAAAADAAGGATTITCELGGLEILGEVLGDQTCTDGSLGTGVDAAVDAAMGVVGDVLASLPGVSGVDGLRLDLLPTATQEVATDDDGTVTARAQAVLLELVVPSVTIDPSEALDLLDLPTLADLDGLGDLVDDALADLGLDELLDTEELAGLTGALDGLVDEVDGLLGQVLGLLGELELDVLGIEVRTPAIQLVLDPVSEATFTPADADEPVDDPGDDPGDDPVPSDDEPTPATGDPDAPELPKTGGGLALLGLLAMLGAAALRRTG